MGGDVLQYHNRVIHNHTDRNRQRRQRDKVQRRARRKQIDEGRYQRNRNGHTDDERRTPATQEDHNDDDDEYKRQQNGLGQRVDTLLNVGCTVHNLNDLDITRQRLLDRGQTLLHLLNDLNGICTRLLLDHNHRSTATISTRIHRDLLDRILNLGYVRKFHHATAIVRYNQILQLVAIGELAIGLNIIGTARQVHRTCGHVDILRRNDTANRLDSQTKCIELLGVNIDLNLAHGLTYNRHCTDTVHAVQYIHQTVVEDLIECIVAVFRSDRQHHYGHHRGAELEDRGIVHLIGQQGLRTADDVAHVVHRLVQIRTPLHLQGNHRNVVRRGRGHRFQILDRVELILQHTSDVGLDIGSISSRIDRRYRNIRRLHLRILVDRQVLQREESEDDHTQEKQAGRYRLSNG